MSQLSAEDMPAPGPPALVKNRLIQAWTAVVKHPVITSNIFISQEFEIRFILKCCIFTFLGCLLFTGLILFYCRGSLTTSFDSARLVVKQTSLTLFPGVLYTNLIMLTLSSIISIIMTIYILHRIRNLLLRFRENIKMIAKGDLARKVHYRNRDLTTSLAQNINLMTSSLNSKIVEVETGIKKTIEDAPDHNVPDELVGELKHLQHSIRESFIL